MKPRLRPKPGSTLRRRRTRAKPRSGLVDLIKDRPVVEEFGGYGGPAAEIADVRELECRELGGVFREALLVGGPVEVLADEVLGFVAVEVGDELLGDGARLALVDDLVDDGDGGFGEDAGGGVDDLEVGVIALRLEG